MEDLKASGYEDCGHVVLSWKKAIPVAVVQASLLALARIHAWGWGGKGLDRTMWTPLMVGCSSAQYLGKSHTQSSPLQISNPGCV